MTNKSRVATICQLFTNRSLSYFHLGEHDKAIEDADYVISNVDPKNSKAYFRKGLSLAKLGKNDKAFIELAQACKLEPTNDLYSNELKNIKEAMKKK
jgi:tetratricopeptide (TPR) repeat protein